MTFRTLQPQRAGWPVKMPDRKKKSGKKMKTDQSMGKVPENQPAPEESWHPSEVPPPDYELLSVTPSMENVRAQMDIVLEHLTKDETVKNYSSEFVRMYESTSVAHTEKRDYHLKIERQRAKLEEQEKLLNELNSTVDWQKQEIRKKNAGLEALLAETSFRREREVSMAELVGSLRKEIIRIRNWEDLRTGDEEGMEDTKVKNQLLAQKVALQEELLAYKHRLADTYEALEEVGREEAQVKEVVAALEEKLQTAHDELRTNVAKRNIVEGELRDERNLNEGNKLHITQLSELLKSAGDTINSLKSNVIEQRAACSLLQRERDDTNQHLEGLSRNHNRLLEKVRAVQNDVARKTQQLDDVNKLLLRNSTLSRRLEGKVKMALSSLNHELTRSEKTIQEKKALLDEQKKNEYSLKQCRVKIKDNEDKVKQLNVKNNALLVKLARSESNVADMASKNVALTQLRKRLDNDYKSAKKEKLKLDREINEISVQKQRCQNEVAVLALQLEIQGEEVTNKLGEISRCKKELANIQTQLQAQLNAYENLLFHRNSLAKNLHEREGRLVMANSDIKIATHSIGQLKENLSLQENKIHFLNVALERAASLREELSTKIDKGNARENKLTLELKEMRKKEKNNVKEIKFLEKELNMTKRRFKEMVYERNVIGTQLVRKNDEIQILRVANKNFRKECVQGHNSYSERLHDIRILRSEVINLRRQSELFFKRPAMVKMPREISNLTRDLAIEMMKRSSLEEECTNITNVHSWRKLESSHPSRLELIRKVSVLQNRIIRLQREKITQKEQLRESDRLFGLLRRGLSDFPASKESPETKRILERQRSSIKALIAEARANVIDSRFCNDAIRQARLNADSYKKMFLSAKTFLLSFGVTFTGRMQNDRL